MNKITNFSFRGKDLKVEYVESMNVKEGVDCDVYRFSDDDSRDLAIVTVQKGFSTPLQRILEGDITTEGYIDGEAILKVESTDGIVKTYVYPNNVSPKYVEIKIGEKMQWTATETLTFFEVCSPPYKDGRFENIPE